MLSKTGLFTAIGRKESRDWPPTITVTAFLLSITTAELTASNSHHIENSLKTASPMRPAAIVINGLLLKRVPSDTYR